MTRQVGSSILSVGPDRSRRVKPIFIDSYLHTNIRDLLDTEIKSVKIRGTK